MEKLFGVEMTLLASLLFAAVVVILALLTFLGMRNRILVKMALRNIPRRKAQSILIVVGLMLSTTIIAASLAIGDTVANSIRTTVSQGLGHTDVRVTSPQLSQFGDRYLSAENVAEIVGELDDDERVDGVMPQIRETLPVLFPGSGLTEARTSILGYDQSALDGFGEVTSVDGATISLGSLSDDEVVINVDLAENIGASAGDEIRLVTPAGRRTYTVAAVAERGNLAAAEPRLLIPLASLQRDLDRAGQVTTIDISVQGGAGGNTEMARGLGDDLRDTFTDQASAETLFDALSEDAIVDVLRDRADEGGFGSGDLRDLVTELERDEITPEFKSLVADTQTAALVLAALEGADRLDVAQRVQPAVGTLQQYSVDAIKPRLLDIASEAATQVTTLFTVFGTFSIIVGLLLIFLVFVLLAASRTNEMGIARAIGMKRRHLVQMFTFEGAAYALGAAVVGTAAGVLASIALVALLVQALGSNDDFPIRYSITPISLLAAFSTGMLITLLTVGISAYRVSKLNIVVAIRGLSQEFVRDHVPTALLRLRRAGLWLGGPLTMIIAGASAAGNGRGFLGLLIGVVWLLVVAPLVLILGSVAIVGLPEESADSQAAVTGLLTVVIAIIWLIAFFWQVFKFFQPWLALGWPLIVVGSAVAALGINQASAGFWTLGVSVALVGVGLLSKWLMEKRNVREVLRTRISMTLMGGLVLAFWGLPFSALEGITGELTAGVEMFILSGVWIVGSAVWIVMYNADVLAWIANKVSGRTLALRPVIKMSVAYPMSARFRTGLTLAMFSLVIFTLMIFAILTNLGNAFLNNPDLVSGGYDISSSINRDLPIDDAAEKIAASGEISPDDIDVIARRATLGAQARVTDGEDLQFRFARVVGADEVWLTTNVYGLTHWDPAYGDTPEEVWQAVANDPSLALVAGNVLAQAQTGPPGTQQSQSLRIDGIDPAVQGDMEAVDITIRPPLAAGGSSAATVQRKVVGVLDQFADAFEASSADVYMRSDVLSQLSPEPVPFTSYKFRLTEGVDPVEIASKLETVFIDHSMVAESIVAQLEENQRQNQAFNNLFQGFMGLGLVVGVASLGVISFRAVVERRQSIGMMRALGFRARMIQVQFLLESSIIAMLGAGLGIGLGTWIAYNIFDSIREQADSVVFSVPWLNVGVIVGISLVFSLVATWVPARQAAKIYPSEALRYE